jgi:DNA (cytosine-5)-methyltransferase 1
MPSTHGLICLECGANPPDAIRLLPTPSTHDKTGARTPEQRRRMEKPFCNLNDTVVNELLPTPRASDPANASSHSSEGFRPQLGEIARTLLPTPTAMDSVGARNSTSGRSNPDSQHHSGTTLGDGAHSSAWGKYEPAIRRWESLTRPAPPPTEPNKNGNPRLAAAFSEWLMGWPDRWVTDPAIGISRNDQLRIVGNGVCPQQAAAALRYLLAVAEVSA